MQTLCPVEPVQLYEQCKLLPLFSCRAVLGTVLDFFGSGVFGAYWKYDLYGTSNLKTSGGAQVSGVMITREDFMVSIFDYNKDAEEAERAEKAAPAGGAGGGGGGPPGSPGATAYRNLSDGRGCDGAGGGSAVGRGSPRCEDWGDRFPGWQWVVPAWLIAAVLAAALVWDKQTWLGGLIRQCSSLNLNWPRARRRLLCCGEGGAVGKCEA